MFIKYPYDMDHVGTRAEHLAELQDLWSFAYGVLTDHGYHSDREKAHALELSIALDMLETHMQYQYHSTPYAKVINELPKDATMIKDSQGESNYNVERPTGTH